jgi:hypothetical protein
MCNLFKKKNNNNKKKWEIGVLKENIFQNFFFLFFFGDEFVLQQKSI